MERYTMSWIGTINIVKMTILSNRVYKFNIVPIKLSMVFFTELEQKISQFVCPYKNPLIAKTILRKKNGAKEESIFMTSVYTTKLIIKTVWYWHKNRNIDQWNTIESPEINPCICEHLIFDKEGKNIQWRKDSLFDKWCWKNWTATCKE